MVRVTGMLKIRGFEKSGFHNNNNICTGEGGTPCNGPYGEAPPERGNFFRPQVYKRVGISHVEVYKRVGKSVI